MYPKVSGDQSYYQDHGTHVAGIAAANTNNGFGIAGTNWNAHIYARNMHGFDYTDIYNAVIDILRHRSIRAFNNSWNLVSGDDIIVHKAFAMAYSCNTTPVAARGNFFGEGGGGNSPIYPACFGDWMISVGAMAKNGNRAWYSYYGQNVDFIAPGGSDDGNDQNDILSTLPGNNFGYKHGTSMAAPFVTGIISLIGDYMPIIWSTKDYEKILQISAQNLGPAGYDDETGWGMVKAGAALDSITNNAVRLNIQSQSTPYVYQTFPEETMTCYGWLGLPADGNYQVVRKEIRADVNYENDGLMRFCSVHVWGEPLCTIGRSYEGHINYDIPFCEVVPGSETLDGCTLMTYVYDVWSSDHSIYYGELPTGIGGSRWLSYSILFKPACTGPINLDIDASSNEHPLISWIASAFGDITNYHIYRKVDGIDNDFVHIADVPATTLEYEDLDYYVYTIPPAPQQVPTISPAQPSGSGNVPLSLPQPSSGGNIPIALSRPSNGGDTPQPLVAKNAEYTVTADDGCRESIMPSPVSIQIDVPCEYVVGDVNGSGVFDGIDVTYSVNYFEGSGAPPVYECECTSGDTWYVAGDVNGSCIFNGLDVLYMVKYLEGRVPALIPCPDCPPGGFHLLSDGNNLGSSETIASEMNSSILVEASRSDSIRNEIIADVYLTSNDSVAFINIPLQWRSRNIAAVDFQPSHAISGWEELHTTFGNGQLLFLAWNDVGRNQDGNKDPIISNGRPIYLGQFTFSVSDTADIRDFAPLQFDNPRNGSMMLGHPNGRRFSLPNFRFNFRGRNINAKETDEQFPSDYSLMQNYPNPFNLSTLIKYSLPEANNVTIEIYDLSGRKVWTLRQGNQDAGNHEVVWNAEGMSSGIYFYKINAGDFSQTKRMLLLK